MKTADVANELLAPGDRRRSPLRHWRAAVALVASCAAYALTENLGRDGALPSKTQYFENLWQSLVVFSFALLIVWIAAALAPRQRIVRAAALTLAMTLGIVVGYAIGLGPGQALDLWQTDPLRLLSVSRFVAVGLVGVALFLIAELNEHAQQAFHVAAERHTALDREATEARLAVLRAQVEPHFLFNTLAHVRRLYATEPRAGRAMLRNFVRYVGDARPALQCESLPLAEDARLAEAYLSLQQVRMGDRLSFEFDLPTETCAARVPPMMLTTLVENCVEHALSPLPAGGAIRVSAVTTSTTTRIEVTDNGRGFTSSTGSGIGLANLRARLETLYGTAATLELRQNPTAGVTATVVVPHEPRGRR